MDRYAGGRSQFYAYHLSDLKIANQRIKQLQHQLQYVNAHHMHDLLSLYEVRERLLVCQCLLAHLAARKETRWHSFADNLDYPQQDDRYLKYVNSVYQNGEIHIIYRDLVKRGLHYEHQN